MFSSSSKQSNPSEQAVDDASVSHGFSVPAHPRNITLSAEDCSPQLLSREQLLWKSKKKGPRDWRKRNRFFWFAFAPSIFLFSVEFSLVAVLVIVSGCIVGRVNVASSAIRETVLFLEQIRCVSEESEWERL